MATALVAFAGDSGATIVAEGIEIAREAEAVRRLRICFGQGHYFAPPAAVVDVSARLAV
jgi:EAL domain-containing protein (putative c-di-GMP-specific phosphodiesterase class I)